MNIAVQNRNVTIPLDTLIGSYRTFGNAGPLYEILSVIEPAEGTSVLLRIRVIPSGEELNYALSEAMDDPVAR